jgi:hypothetical protein
MKIVEVHYFNDKEIRRKIHKSNVLDQLALSNGLY